MRVILHSGAQAFLDAGDAFLQRDPFSANVIAVVAHRMADAAGDATGVVWATVEDPSGHVAGVAMQTPPNALFVSRMPEQAAVADAQAV